ncbi:MAG: hypothetical protein AAF959_22065 [Cyanobacteria bacterium P01_D01_bin.56]
MITVQKTRYDLWREALERAHIPPSLARDVAHWICYGEAPPVQDPIDLAMFHAAKARAWAGCSGDEDNEFRGSGRIWVGGVA